MKLIGLTGGVGMGKSTSARLMEERGWPVADTDLIARVIVEPGEPALQEIVNVFGPEMLDEEGKLRRPELARCVFGDESKRRQLEGILHPRIRAHWQAQVDAWRAEGRAVAVVAIPLLFETGAAKLFDTVICVACSAPAQRERLRHRGWDDNQVQQRIRAQWSIDQKMDRSDYVIWTDGSMALHAEQVALVCHQLNG